MINKSRKSKPGSRIRENDKRPGKILDLFRRDLGISIVRIAELIDCSYQQAAKYLEGSNRMSPARILAASEYLRISPAAFFREATSPKEIEDLFNRAELEYQLQEIQESLTVEEINRLIDIAKIVFDLNYGPEKE